MNLRFYYEKLKFINDDYEIILLMSDFLNNVVKKINFFIAF